MTTRTCTVVFTDLANYTASVGRSDREGVRNLVAAHEKLVTPMLEQHGGQVLKNLGDSFMALFPAATDAVRAGIHLIETISGEDGFHIRVAMATGDVEAIAGDAFGEVVNLSSRILSKTPVGQVWFSQATLLCMNQAEIAWEGVGRYTLKGISGDVPVFRAVPTGRAWLPEPVIQAVRTGRLVRFVRGDPPPRLPPQPVVLLEGFPPGSQVLTDAISSLPVVDPASLWLMAYTLPPSDRVSWQRAGRGLVIGTSEAVEAEIQETRRRMAYTTGSDTIILEGQGSAAFELVLAGLALPAVPMSEVVAGYTYDLLADGRWVNHSDHAIARVDVSAEKVALLALAPGVRVGSRQLQGGQSVDLKDGDQLQTPSGVLTCILQPGGPYAALLVGEGHVRLGIAPGQQAEIGREPNHPGLALPDRRGQENIRWYPGFRATRVRDSGFTIDRALAGRRQAAIVLENEQLTLISLHERCPTFILEGVLENRQLAQINAPRAIQAGDLVVAGTSVVAVQEPSS